MQRWFEFEPGGDAPHSTLVISKGFSIKIVSNIGIAGPLFLPFVGLRKDSIQIQDLLQFTQTTEEI
jgi:hypothetical protein